MFLYIPKVTPHTKIFWKNFRTAPYLIMHVHLTGDTLNNKAPYMDV